MPLFVQLRHWSIDGPIEQTVDVRRLATVEELVGGPCVRLLVTLPRHHEEDNEGIEAFLVAARVQTELLAQRHSCPH